MAIFDNLFGKKTEASDADGAPTDLKGDVGLKPATSAKDIRQHLADVILPSIDVWTIRSQILRAQDRSKVLSHEIETTIIRQKNEDIRAKFRQVLSTIVNEQHAALARRIADDRSATTIDQALRKNNVFSFVTFHEQLTKFLEALQTGLQKSCEVVATLAIKHLDEVGVYNDELAKIAQMPSEDKKQAQAKSDRLRDYLGKRYQNQLKEAFESLKKEGWPEIQRRVASCREDAWGMLTRHEEIKAQVLRTRPKEKVGLFEEIDEAIKAEKFQARAAALKSFEDRVKERETRSVRLTQRITAIEQELLAL